MTRMIHSQTRALICLPTNHIHQFINVHQILGNRIEETTCLEVLGRSTNRNGILFNDVTYPETIRCNRSKAEETKSGITAIGSGKNGCVNELPTRIGEDGWKKLLFSRFV